jgi:NAD(P)-dependent dehydrogenase (short-subunit alcohol dehydrogenase family)
MAEKNRKRVALVTGGNKGIGFETARQLASRGMKVLLGARSEQRGKAAAGELRDQGLDVEFLHIDVDDRTTHETAHRFVESAFGRLDILINNAGIALDVRQKPSEIDLETLRRTFETNFFGAVSVTQLLLPLIRASEAGRIVNVSSGLGSLTRHGDPGWEFYGFIPLAYNASKTALNAFTVLLAHELKDTGVKVNSADPGYTATDMTANQGHKTVEQGAAIIVELATLPADGPTGSYFDDRGRLPW